MYAKSADFSVNLLPRTIESDSGYSNPDNDPRGPWITSSYVNPARREARPNLAYPIEAPDGRIIEHPTNAWKFSREENKRHIAENRLWWGSDGHAQYPRLKLFLNEARGLTPINFWKHEYAGNTRMGGNDVAALLGKKYFDFPKPVLLLKRVLEHASSRDCIVLDFFSGSGTTAEAVMSLNAEDGGTRQFIMVQLPAATDEKGEAFRDGYLTISDIAEERIRRAGDKIASEIDEDNRQLKLGEEPKRVPDTGFRVLAVGESCIKDTYTTPDGYVQESLDDLIDNIAEDATPLDLLFQSLPAFRIPYSAKIVERDIAGKTVFDVNDGQLLACFDTGLTTEAIEAVAREKPLYALFRDASIADDATVANIDELFKTFSPDTVRRVI